MGSENEYRLHKEVQRLNDYIADQRTRHMDEVRSLKASLKDEIAYSSKLRSALDSEYEHCEKLRKQLDERKKLVSDLRDDLDDERKYVEKLEKKLDHRARQIEKLEDELYDLEEDYADAYRALKKMDGLKAELANAKMLSAFTKDRVAQLQDEVRSLKSMSPSSPSRVIVTSSPSIRASEPHFPRTAQGPKLPLELRLSDFRPPTEDGSDVSDAEVEEDRYTAPSPVSLHHEGLSEVEEGEYEDAVAAQETEVVQMLEEEEEDEEAQVIDEEESEPGQRERGLAEREQRLADRESQRARDAFESGNKAFARQLKESAMAHRAAARDHNRDAAATIFQSLNPTYYTSLTGCQRIDLHRLYTREALEFVRSHLSLCRARGMSRSEIIVGRGNHSKNGIARLKPAVLEMLEKEEGIEIDMSANNPGSFHVNFLDTLRRGRGGKERLENAAKTVSDVRQGLDEIERGMEGMKIKGAAKSKGARQGLRDVTNRQY